MELLSHAERPQTRPGDYVVSTASGVYLISGAIVAQGGGLAGARVVVDACQQAVALAAQGGEPLTDAGFGAPWRAAVAANLALLHDPEREGAEIPSEQVQVLRGVLVHNLALLAQAAKEVLPAELAERLQVLARQALPPGQGVTDRPPAVASPASLGPMIGIRQPDGSVRWLPPGAATPVAVAAKPAGPSPRAQRPRSGRPGPRG